MASHRTIYSIMFAFLGLASTAALQVAHGTARLASVRRGLEQATRRETHNLGDFSKYTKD